MVCVGRSDDDNKYFSVSFPQMIISVTFRVPFLISGKCLNQNYTRAFLRGRKSPKFSSTEFQYRMASPPIIAMLFGFIDKEKPMNFLSMYPPSELRKSYILLLMGFIVVMNLS